MNSKQPDINTLFFDFIGVLLIQREDYIPNVILDEIDKLAGQVENDRQFRKTIIEKYHFDNDGFQNALGRIVEKYEAFTPIWNILPMLRKHYKLGIINNGTYLTIPQFEAKYNISKLFDVFISSGIEGVRKPDARIYQLACNKLGVKPEQCLFIDDSEDNVMGARKVGMNVIHWQNPDSGYKILVNLLEN